MSIKYLFSFSILFLIYFGCKHEATQSKIVIPIDTTSYPSNNVNKIDSICYQEMIEPILLSTCGKNGCHNNSSKEKGINVSSYSTLKSTLSGALLLQCIQDKGTLGMPPEGYQKLDSNQVLLIKNWVMEGMQVNIDCEGPCDTNIVTYSNTIKPIIQNSCNGCHTSSSPILTHIDSVRYQINQGKFLCSIQQNSTCKPMPQNAPKLSNCKISQIQKWILAGMPNN